MDLLNILSKKGFINKCMSKENSFKWEWPKKESHTIVPVFLPFMGCKTRCIFCAQDAQTGIKINSINELNLRLSEAFNILQARIKSKLKPCELAFYGGTFTALPENEWELCLNFASHCLKLGYISGFRCSTRPDSLTSARLKEMKDAGCKLVELGIQSFADQALVNSQRSYNSDNCHTSCKNIIKENLQLGIQLMPGMPGMNQEIFFDDIIQSIKERATILRFYPCLVISRTKLATLWQSGFYKPWALNDTINYLAEAWLLAAVNNISVIRMGLAPQMGLSARILAGPAHPALGNRVMSKALFLIVKLWHTSLPSSPKKFQLSLPKHLQGLIWGWKKELTDNWLKLGVDSKNIHWMDSHFIELNLLD